MDALDVVRVCVKRWWVILPILLLAGVAGFGLSRQLKPEYAATGSYALVYAHSEAIKLDQPDPRNANPLAAEGGVLLGEAIVADLTAPATELSLGSGTRGFGPGQADNQLNYAVTLPQNAKSFLVQTWGDSQNAVRSTVDAVLRAAPLRAKVIQDRVGAPETSQYTTFTTSPTQVTELPPQSKVKIILTVLGIGLVAGAALALLVDRLIVRQKRAKRRMARRVARQWVELAEMEAEQEPTEGAVTFDPSPRWSPDPAEREARESHDTDAVVR